MRLPGMGQDALAALAAATEIGLAFRGLRAHVVQRRRFLNGEDHRLPPGAAVGGRFAVRRETCSMVIPGFDSMRSATFCSAFVRKMTVRFSPIFFSQARSMRTMRSRTRPCVWSVQLYSPLRPVHLPAVEGARLRAPTGRRST